MILPLFKRNMKRGCRLMVIFMAIITMYTVAIIYMYNENMAEMLAKYQELMPEMMAAVGMTGTGSSLLEFINTYLNGFIMLIIPMVFTMVLVNSFLMQYIDKGTMAYLLTSTRSRKEIIFTQIISVIFMQLLFFVYITLTGVVCSELMFPGKLDISRYILMNTATLFMQIMVAGICTLAASIANETKWYLATGVGIPLAFYVIQMMANMGGSLKGFRYLTIYTLLPYDEIIKGSGYLSSIMIMAGGAMTLFAIVEYVFTRKDFNV